MRTLSQRWSHLEICSQLGILPKASKHKSTGNAGGTGGYSFIPSQRKKGSGRKMADCSATYVESAWMAVQ